MDEIHPLDRRQYLTAAGVTVGSVLVAGCSDNGGGPEDTDDTDDDGGMGGDDNETDGGMDDNETEDDNETGVGDDNESGNETGAGNETGNETGAGNETDNETGAGNETGGGGAAGAIEPGTQIEFSAQTTAWVGIAPDSIADQENPELTLQSGESYEIGWTEGDGAQHNIEIRNDNDEVIDDLETEITSDPGDGQWLEFEASDEMSTYVCRPHQTTMVGDISVE